MRTALFTLFALLFFIISCEDSENSPTPSIKESDTDNQEESYQLPVIFHIFYDGSDSDQTVTTKRIKEIIDACNKYYDNSNNKSVDIHLKFILATHNNEGKVLSEAGIERIKVNNAELDCDNFMDDKSNIQYLWDTDQYINIMLYRFTNKNILGISYLPYTVKPDKLEGLNQLNFLPTHSTLTYPHCISINKLYINGKANIEGQIYNPSDVIATLAHEFGHYLGLYHTFNETKDSAGNIITNLCEDTDYCTDTPPYNRDEYKDFLDNYIPKNGIKITFNDLPYLMERKNCMDNTQSTPNNIMDYEYSYVNRFTNEQKNRIRYVLAHSPLIPGKKVTRSITKTTAPQEFPMRTIK